MQRLVVVSNRLPVTVEKRKGAIVFRQSVGGVATGLASIARPREAVWVGWAEVPVGRISTAEKADIADRLWNEHGSKPVFLGQRDIAGFYQGFSNRTLWPLFHHFDRYVEFDTEYWHAYERVNRAYRDALLEVVEPGDSIWVHDYQLLLLPALLRESLPDAPIGFFLHIPFPSYEAFRMLPWRREILNGMLGADLVGFHTFDYARHFLSGARSLLGLEDRDGQIQVDDRLVRVDAFPMGIDVQRFQQEASGPKARRRQALIRRADPEQRIILSVDRLDYTKGIPERLRAFDAFLDEHPEWRGRVRLVCVAVPSRTRVERYLRLKQEVDRLVGEVNGRWGTVDWLPVTYLYRALPTRQLVDLYAASDVALVTPLRDGMNLVAKEYVACQLDGRGVLILSEMAGAARELSDALVVNPYDRDAVVEALDAALTMPEDERRRRNTTMQGRLKRYDVGAWAEDFLQSLDRIKLMQVAYDAHVLTPQQDARLLEAARTAAARVVVLDYDGTLVPFSRRPGAAVPDPELLALLERIGSSPSTTLLLVSGRDRATMQSWFGEVSAVLIAEHGAWVHEPASEWVTTAPVNAAWKDAVRPVLDHVVDRTPGSFVEEKDFSLAWHYRLAQADQAGLRLRELTEGLSPMAESLGLSLMEGNQVLEVKMASINKGLAAHRWMTMPNAEFVLAAGDDKTDEDLFEASPDHAWTIKVGRGPSRARSSLHSWREMRALLREISEVIR
jgi:trehalose 6-phosphate synthase/phosphatase